MAVGNAYCRGEALRVSWSRPLRALLRVPSVGHGAVFVGALGMWLGGTPRAVAAPEQEPIRLEYVADVGCPSGDDFQRMVFKRTRSARPALDEEAARLFTVTLQREQQTVQGSLTVREGEQSLVRRVNGRDCAQLASVLALATALAIDPSAELLPSGTEGEGSPERVDTSAASSVAPPAKPPLPAAPLPSDSPIPYDPPDALPSDSGRRVLRIAAGPRVEWAATPYPAVGPTIALELGAEAATWTVGIAASLLLTPSKEVATAQADFRILTASLHVCSLAFRWQNWVQAGPCLQADFGDIYATASDIPFRESTHRFWSTLGVNLELLTQLSNDWHLALDIGPKLILTQYRFEFNEPDTKVFQQGSWAGSARLMLGRSF